MMIIQRYYFHINIVLIQIGNSFFFCFSFILSTSNYFEFFVSPFILLSSKMLNICNAIHHALPIYRMDQADPIWVRPIWYHLRSIYNIINCNRFRPFSELNKWICSIRRHWFLSFYNIKMWIDFWYWTADIDIEPKQRIWARRIETFNGREKERNKRGGCRAWNTQTHIICLMLMVI